MYMTTILKHDWVPQIVNDFFFSWIWDISSTCHSFCTITLVGVSAKLTS